MLRFAVLTAEGPTRLFPPTRTSTSKPLGAASLQPLPSSPLFGVSYPACAVPCAGRSVFVVPAGAAACPASLAGCQWHPGPSPLTSLRRLRRLLLSAAFRVFVHLISEYHPPCVYVYFDLCGWMDLERPICPSAAGSGAEAAVLLLLLRKLLHAAHSFRTASAQPKFSQQPPEASNQINSLMRCGSPAGSWWQVTWARA